MAERDREEVAYLSDVSRTPHDAVVGNLVEFGENGYLRNSSSVIPTSTSQLENDSGFITESSLSGYVRGNDLESILSGMGVVRSDDLLQYLKVSDIELITSAFVKLSELDSKVSGLGYVKAGSLEGYVTLDYLDTCLDGYAKTSDIEGMVKGSDLEDILDDYSKKTDIEGFVKESDLLNSIEALDHFAEKSELEGYVEIGALDTILDDYVKSEDLEDKVIAAGFAKTSDISGKRDYSDLSVDISKYWFMSDPEGEVSTLVWNPTSSSWSREGCTLSFSSGTWRLSRYGEFDMTSEGSSDDNLIVLHESGNDQRTYYLIRGRRIALDTDIPTHVGQLANDAGYATWTDVEEAIPTKVSELDNDENFVSKQSLETEIEELGFVKEGALSEKRSIDDLSFNRDGIWVVTKPDGSVLSLELDDQSHIWTCDAGIVLRYTSRWVLSVIGAEHEFISEGDGSDSKIELTAQEYPGVKYIAVRGSRIALDSDIPTVPHAVSELENDAGYITSADVPTKVSDLTNDEGYITEADVPTKVSELTNDKGYVTAADVPTKVSELTNDKGYVTAADVPTKVSDLTNDEGYITAADVPTKVSELTNDKGYVTAADVPTKVSDLTNDEGYVTAADVPTKVSDLTNDEGYITSEDVPTKVSDLTNDEGFLIQESVAPKFSTSESYSVGDKCTYEGRLYECKLNVGPSPVWIPNAWEAKNVFDLMPEGSSGSRATRKVVTLQPVSSGNDRNFYPENSAVNIVNVNSDLVVDGISVWIIQPNGESQDGVPVSRCYDIVFVNSSTKSISVSSTGNLYNSAGESVTLISHSGKSTSYTITEYDRSNARFIVTGANDTESSAMRDEIERALDKILQEGGYIQPTGPAVTYLYDEEDEKYHKIMPVRDPETNQMNIGIEETGVNSPWNA